MFDVNSSVKAARFTRFCDAFIFRYLFGRCTWFLQDRSRMAGYNCTWCKIITH
jgi:hypothetical protein